MLILIFIIIVFVVTIKVLNKYSVEKYPFKKYPVKHQRNDYRQSESFLRAISDDDDNDLKKVFTVELAGVGDYFDKGDAFDAVQVKDEVYTITEPNNAYDDKAIAVYTMSDLKIGYIPIKSERFRNFYYYNSDGQPICFVVKKWIEDESFHKIKIKAYFNYTDKEIEEIKIKNKFK